MNAPRCGVHVGVVMVLSEGKAPTWVMNPDGADETGERDNRTGTNRKCFTRKSWRCPVAGCWRVAAYAPTEEEAKDLARRPCTKCGEPTTARVYCAECMTEYQVKRNAKKREERAARNGVGKGFYSGAKARRIARELRGETDFEIGGGEAAVIEVTM